MIFILTLEQYIYSYISLSWFTTCYVSVNIKNAAISTDDHNNVYTSKVTSITIWTINIGSKPISRYRCMLRTSACDYDTYRTIKSFKVWYRMLNCCSMFPIQPSLIERMSIYIISRAVTVRLNDNGPIQDRGQR